MGGMSIWHWVLVLVVVMLLFGGSRVSNMMGDVAKGIKNFKKGMAEDDDPKPTTHIEGKAAPEPQIEREADRVREER